MMIHVLNLFCLGVVWGYDGMLVGEWRCFVRICLHCFALVGGGKHGLNKIKKHHANNMILIIIMYFFMFMLGYS